MNLDEMITKRATEITEQYKERLAPRASLGLSPLLDERRIQYGIPNGAFSQRALYDRMLLWQIPYEYHAGETYGDGPIVMSDAGKDRAKAEAPRGVIVTAGLQALDVLHSHGSGVGHIVKFIRLAPWRIPCDYVGGHEFSLLVLRVGDLIADEDLEQKLRSREWAIRCEKDKDGSVKHVLLTQDGKRPSPEVPFIAEEY